MRRFRSGFLIGLALVLGCGRGPSGRMDWWREARFGLFIHWGLYAIPAGEWQGKTQYGEWIRHSAQIPLETYDRLVDQFNPQDFDADAWVLAAKQAGMKYVVITTKHHDGFCLFDSEYTDFDVMSTPFKRDIMKEMAEACHRHGLKIGWYYSIMDWHHLDYLPRRDWEKNRPVGDANFERYFKYMMAQLKELLTHYGTIDILWFDGEWEKTWKPELGRKLYQYVRKLQPNIIVNNRVGGGRSGMDGFDSGEEYAGDFFTPEQTIPDQVDPNMDWESCITLNDHWGYCRADSAWKPVEKLIPMLSTIAAKGGNLLLNVGPTAEGRFPEEALKRLSVMGTWLDYYGEAIYGTRPGPFKSLEWGACTQKRMGQLTRLYLHVYKFPSDGRLRLPGLYNQAETAFDLAEPDWTCGIERKGADLELKLPKQAYDRYCSVVALDIWGKPDVDDPPEIVSDFDVFVGDAKVALKTQRKNVVIRYALDGSNPTVSSPAYEKPLVFTEGTLVTARCFRNGQPVSRTIRRNFRRVEPQAGVSDTKMASGVRFALYQGDWDKMPPFGKLQATQKGKLDGLTLSSWEDQEYVGLIFSGYFKVPKTGVYGMRLASDDGSRLYVGSTLVVDNDGLHGLKEASGVVALEKGVHPFVVQYFNKTGSGALKWFWRGPGFGWQEVGSKFLGH